MSLTSPEELAAVLNLMKDRGPDSIILFDFGAYYSVYNEDAQFMCVHVYQSTTLMKDFYLGKDCTKYITFGKQHAPKLVKKLVLEHRRALYIYQGSPGKTGREWNMSVEVSPGNFHDLEDGLLGEGQTTLTSIAALTIMSDATSGSRCVGFASCCPGRAEMKAAEFSDTEQFVNLDAYLLQMDPQPCEILVAPMGTSQETEKTIDALKQKFDIPIQLMKRAEFSSEDIIQDLNRLLKFKKGEAKNAAVLPEINLEKAMSSLAACIRFLGLLNQNISLGKYKLDSVSISGFMYLNASTLKSLAVVDTSLRNQEEATLFQVINNCRTAMGSRTLTRWLRQPLVDLEALERRQEVIQIFFDDFQLRDLLHNDLLPKVPDLDRIGRRLLRGNADLKDCYQLYQAVDQANAVANEFRASVAAAEPDMTSVMDEALNDFTKFKGLMDTTIELGAARDGEFIIKADFDDQLLELKTMMDEILKEKAEEILQRSGRSLRLDSIKLSVDSKSGILLRVTKKEEKALRNSRVFEIVSSQAGAVTFTTKELAALSEEYLVYKGKYAERQEELVIEIVTVVATFIDPLLRLSNALGCADVLVGLAVAASNAPIPYTRPKLLPASENRITLREARHPCLEQFNAVIPNDVQLDRCTDRALLVVTGPNMGGKSTYMRTAALCVLLAQIGSFVPCARDSAVSVRKSLIARVGATDCVQRGVSTLMMEMVDMSAALRMCTENAFLIVDELGRGTSTYDGFGIASATAEYIATELPDSLCLFATHYHELTRLEGSVAGVANIHLAADVSTDEELTLLYKVEEGGCLTSLGMKVAEACKLPEEVLTDAKALAASTSLAKSATLTEPDFADIAALNGLYDAMVAGSDSAGEELKNSIKEVMERNENLAIVFS